MRLYSVIFVLAAQNAVRAQVGIAPLTWSDKLAAYAQSWADTLLARGEFVHRIHSPYGENLFDIFGAPATPERVVEAWASESRDYDYRSGAATTTHPAITWGGVRINQSPRQQFNAAR